MVAVLFVPQVSKLGQPVLEFSGVRLMLAGAPMSHSIAV
jgi:hypothetical protein